MEENKKGYDIGFYHGSTRDRYDNPYDEDEQESKNYTKGYFEGTNYPLKKWAKTAIDIQDACNLSGIIHSFSIFITWLREEYPNKGTEFYNTHFVSVLFADKIKSLTGASFSEAYNEAKKVVEN